MDLYWTRGSAAVKMDNGRKGIDDGMRMKCADVMRNYGLLSPDYHSLPLSLWVNVHTDSTIPGLS